MSYLFSKGTFSIFCNILKRNILLPTSLKLHNSDQKNDRHAVIYNKSIK